METRELVLQKSDEKKKLKKIKVTVQKATYKMGIMRSAIMANQGQIVDEMKISSDHPFAEATEMALRLTTYPALIAGTVETEGFENWPLTYDQVAQLPEQWGADWEKAVFELNPHWIPEIRDVELKKKETKSAKK